MALTILLVTLVRGFTYRSVERVDGTNGEVDSFRDLLSFNGISHLDNRSPCYL